MLLLAVPLAYVFDRFLIHYGWTFSEIFRFWYASATIAFPIAAGLTIFQSEKKDRAFEYLFSLPLSRFQILMYKFLPRLVLLLVLITVSIFFSVYTNIWINGFNLVVLFLISTFMSISFSSLAMGFIGISIFFYVYYHFSRTIHAIFVSLKPESMDPFSLAALFYNLLSAVLLLTPLGIAFWITFKKLDVKPLKLQMKSYYLIVLPTLVVFIAFIIIFFKMYLSLSE